MFFAYDLDDFVIIFLFRVSICRCFILLLIFLLSLLLIVCIECSRDAKYTCELDVDDECEDDVDDVTDVDRGSCEVQA